jgi:uncharacterized membrane protein
MKLLAGSVLAILLFFAGSVSIVRPVYAFDPISDACSNSGASGSSTCTNTNSSNPVFGPTGIITKATGVFAIVIGIIAVIIIMVSGMRFILSGGDAQKVASARNTILYSVIGLVVAVLAQAIVLFVLKKL